MAERVTLSADASDLRDANGPHNLFDYDYPPSRATWDAVCAQIGDLGQLAGGLAELFGWYEAGHEGLTGPRMVELVSEAIAAQRAADAETIARLKTYATMVVHRLGDELLTPVERISIVLNDPRSRAARAALDETGGGDGA